MDERTGELAAARARNLLLGERRADAPVAAVTALLAVQAQEHAFSRWSVAQRTEYPDEAAVLAALASGDIVRTHVLRPTWHYLRGDDLRWLQALTGERVRRGSAGWFRNHGVDQSLVDRSRAVIEGELAGGGARTRKDLKAALTAVGIDVEGQRMAAVLFDLELAAVLCSGPVEGRQHTYALVEERLPKTPTLSEDEATAELVRRYLSGHGPATMKDLRWWSTLTLRQLSGGVQDLGAAVDREVVAGEEYLWLSHDSPFAASAAPDAKTESPRFQLLQVFDELFVGYSQTRGLMDPDGEYGAVLPLGFSKMMHVVLEGTRLAGRWRADKQGKGLVLTVAPDRPLDGRDVAGLERAAAAYGTFVGKEATLALREERTR